MRKAKKWEGEEDKREKVRKEGRENISESRTKRRN